MIVGILTLFIAGSPAWALSAECQETRWKEVLELGRNRDAKSHDRLVQIRDEARGWEAKLAGRMLDLWDPSARTFVTERPQPLFGSCLNEAEMKKSGAAIVPGVITIEVAVDTCGCVKEATPLKPPPDAATREAVLSALKKKRFLPAKRSQGYFENKVVVTCHFDPTTP
jgi:TonB family protein